jgi:hypothetical protein
VLVFPKYVVVHEPVPETVFVSHSLPSPKRTTLFPSTLKVWPSLATVTHSSATGVSLGSSSATAAVSAVPPPPPQAVSAAAAAQVRQR